MTDINSRTARAASNHHNEGSSRSDAPAATLGAASTQCSSIAFAAEDDLWRAAALNDVAHWIGKAKHLVDCLTTAVEADDSLQAVLRARGVGMFDAEWHDHHSAGLEVLHMEVDDHLRQVRRILGIGSGGAAK